MPQFDIDFELNGKQYTADVEAPTEEQAINGFNQMASTPEGINNLLGGQKESVLNKVDRSIGKVVETGINTLALPLELVGESIRLPIEQRPGDSFRAPSLVQQFIPSLETEERPSIGVDVANKLIRAGAAFASKLPSGVQSAQEAAIQAYNMDRGAMGTVEDVAASMLLGRVPLKGAGTSVIQAPFKATGEAIKKTENTIGTASKKSGQIAGRVLAGPTAQQQEILFNRPKAVANAKTVDEIADDVSIGLNRLSNNIKQLDKAATNSLLKLNSEKASDIIKSLNKAKKQFIGKGKSRIGDADKKAIAIIDRYIERVKNMKGSGKGELTNITERQLREIIQSIRGDARFDLLETDPVNRAVQSAQAQLDKTLKNNGNYAEVMGELSKSVRTLKKMASKLRFNRVVGEGFTPSDTTSSKLNVLSSRGFKNKPETKKLFNEFKNKTGYDIEDQLKLSGTREAFSPSDRARGSARTLAGVILGTVIESLVPSGNLLPLLGALTGRAADIYGSTALGSLIRGLRGSRDISRNNNLIDLIRKIPSENLGRDVSVIRSLQD